MSTKFMLLISWFKNYETRNVLITEKTVGEITKGCSLATANENSKNRTQEFRMPEFIEETTIRIQESKREEG